ncbi:MAG: sigma-70 family RNA polymerase sigma factor [Acidobacteriota bacterium]
MSSSIPLPDSTSVPERSTSSRLPEPPALDAELTAWLREWSDGDDEAGARLLAEVYRELRQQAASYLRHERRDITLQPTALVHEVYLRLADQQRIRWHNRAQFFGVAAQMMRRILVDHARSHRAQKRGGDQQRVAFEDVWDLAFEQPGEIVAVDDALEELARLDPGKARLVELRFFGGLQFQEIAEVLGVSIPTVNRHWRVARAFLYRALHPDPSDETIDSPRRDAQQNDSSRKESNRNDSAPS